MTNARPGGAVISSYAQTLDGVGNHRRVVQEEPLPLVVTPTSVTYAYDKDNRLTNAAGASSTYDSNGNTTTNGTDTFAYDFENRLINAVLGGVTNSYRYDGLGNRLARNSGGSVAHFVLDVSGQLAQLLAETNQIGATASHVHGLGLVSSVTPAGGRVQYHYDIRGSTIAMTGESGVVSDSFVQDVFGAGSSKSGTNVTPFKYLGRFGVLHDSSQIIHMRARYYLPDVGRFSSKDRLRGRPDVGQTLHRYVYALNNPVRFADFSGLSPHEGGRFSYSHTTSDTSLRNQVLINGDDLRYSQLALAVISTEGSRENEIGLANRESIGQGAVEVYDLSRGTRYSLVTRAFTIIKGFFGFNKAAEGARQRIPTYQRRIDCIATDGCGDLEVYTAGSIWRGPDGDLLKDAVELNRAGRDIAP